MAEAKETGFFRGAGGAVFEMDLPLGEPYMYHLGKGDLVRVARDGSPWTGGPTPGVGGVEGASDPRDVEIARLRAELAAIQDGGPPLLPDRPANNASKPVWVAFAVSRGMDPKDAEESSRDELVDLFPKE